MTYPGGTSRAFRLGCGVVMITLMLSSAELLDGFATWWTTDRVISIAGGVATLIGLMIAVWQLLRTRRAAEAARSAAEGTTTVLRTSDLSLDPPTSWVG
ncbi:hypothetical protein C8E84_2815 [Ornithinibacter aureus]|nr:hypothetical protein C8E84_2815 [Ornithinibacter aureus]